MRFVVAAFGTACIVGFTGACTEPTGSSVRPSHLALAASLTHATSAIHPNSQKYRDAGFHPATGRSGSAVVSARALLDKAGRTDVEVTTGTFDAGPAPGTLSRVQVKALTPSGVVAFTNNYSPRSATADFPYTRLPHGSGLQIQSLVGGIDLPRGDIVTVATAVHYRPDLVAAHLEAPGLAPVGVAINLHGFIVEQNGEVGARADCVLYVDGAATDRATGIWVDAAGNVTCDLTHVFTEIRTYALELRVENVNPRDFDDSNNRLTASIGIVAPSAFAFYSSQAWDVTDSTWWHNVSTLTREDGIVETWDQIYTRFGPWQSGDISGLIPRMLDYTAPITFHGEMSTNGGTVNTVDLTYPALDFQDWQQGYCGNTFDFGTRAATYICVYTEGDLAGYTYVQYDWGGANIHYTSNSYVYYWDPNGELQQAWYSNEYDDIAPMVTMGAEFSSSLSVQGSNDPEPVTVQATVPLAPVDLHFDYVGPLCFTTPASPGCFELHGHTYGRNGFIAYNTWPVP